MKYGLFIIGAIVFIKACTTQPTTEDASAQALDRAIQHLGVLDGFTEHRMDQVVESQTGGNPIRMQIALFTSPTREFRQALVCTPENSLKPTNSETTRGILDASTTFDIIDNIGLYHTNKKGYEILYTMNNSTLSVWDFDANDWDYIYYKDIDYFIVQQSLLTNKMIPVSPLSNAYNFDTLEDENAMIFIKQ